MLATYACSYVDTNTSDATIRFLSLLLFTMAPPTSKMIRRISNVEGGKGERSEREREREREINNFYYPPPGYAGRVELSCHFSHPSNLYFPCKESQSSRGQGRTLILQFHHHKEGTG